jgi:hypothetical protein
MESQVEIVDVKSTTTRRRLGTQTIVEYQVVVDSENYAQFDATIAKIESGLVPSTFNAASVQLVDAVVSPSRSDSVETAAGVPSLMFAALQSDSEEVRASAALSSSQTYKGPKLTIYSDESTASASTTVEGEGGLGSGVIAGVVIGIVVVVALMVATAYSKRQTSHLATETVLSTDSAIAVSVPVNPLMQAGEDEEVTGGASAEVAEI